MKRIFDLLSALTGLLLTFPILLVISLIIVLSDGWPIFFKQQRVGKGNKLFMLYKFRSMTVLKSAEKGSFDAGNSSRVTSIGRILRKTKLDELPQLINVLKGDMSVVGPRPEVEKWTQVYPERWAKILSVRPGITDNASIKFRDEEAILNQAVDPIACYRNEILPVKLGIYEEYVDSRSFWGDVKIVISTILAVVK
ncbi:sugar transferase [Carboxylicivirga linearis]|uniref:Sugar transferase n=1 Tax=Carboxylicivirga linearis TaxID=1628157 RepID=A0ABS5JWA1_9BACT|nr:sugar transferase [Carboxylicivirga linearis]MBS2099065.1 sugar transferase [Carboxylicivirga linearis]